MNIEQKYRYIIVDDHAFFRDGVNNFLAAHSRFELVGEFSETRSIVNSGDNLYPDFILLDLNIPGLDGRASCEILKKKYPNCKIIALTQYQDMHKILKDLHFDGYVEKQCSDILIEAIDTVLSGRNFFQKKSGKKSHIPTIEKNNDEFLKTIQLSTREIEIIKLVMDGFSNPEIAGKLFISEFTVKTHRKNIYHKTGVNSIADLIKLVNKNGLVDHDD